MEKKKKKFKDLQVGDSFYYIIPNGKYFKYQIKKISRNSNGFIGLSTTSITKEFFSIPEESMGLDIINYGIATLLMNHRVHINSGEAHCDTFDSENLVVNTKLFTYIISIPKEKTSNVNIKTDINTKVMGIADITIPEFTENQCKALLIQTDYGCGKLVDSNIRLDLCKDYKAVELLPQIKEMI